MDWESSGSLRVSERMKIRGFSVLFLLSGERGVERVGVTSERSKNRGNRLYMMPGDCRIGYAYTQRGWRG